jgi:hypothetical protein
MSLAPIPAAARSKAWVCGCLLAEIGGSIPVRGMDVCFLRSLVQRSPTECGASECDREASIIKIP